MGDARQFVDLTHHLAPEVLARKSNPMKDIIRIAINNPHLISLANGDPHESLYPLRRVDFEVAAIDNADPVGIWRSLGTSAPSQVLSSATDASSTRLLRGSLQYGHGAGMADTLRMVTEINNFYHTAPNHVATMSLGNADAITKCFRLLGAPGDYFLADEFTFGPMPIAAEAHGVKWVPVKMDAGGMIPEEMEKILKNWDNSLGRRPHVLYTVPCGQNPTGSTLSLERRERIYQLAQEYDIIIIEDDPYYFLQYDPKVGETPAADKPFPKSLLSLDVDGRVIRVDSFSKIMAPGLRLGWITHSPFFSEPFLRFIDLSTQNPAGFPQAFVTQLLGPSGWQMTGFDRWVRSVRCDYQRRRDFLLELFAKEVALDGWASADVPEAGMFVWIRVYVEKHPRFHADVAPAVEEIAPPAGAVARTNGQALMLELFHACIAGGLLVCPATAFALPTDPNYSATVSASDTGAVSIDDRSNFLRVTFAGSEEVMAAAVPILGRVLREFFADAKAAKQ